MSTALMCACSNTTQRSNVSPPSNEAAQEPAPASASTQEPASNEDPGLGFARGEQTSPEESLGQGGLGLAPPPEGADVETDTNEVKYRGGLDKEIILRIMRGHQDEVRDCYEHGLAKDPQLEGRVLLKFTVDLEGSVSEAAIDNVAEAPPEVGKCIRDAVMTWKFPRPVHEEVTISYPFLLRLGS